LISISDKVKDASAKAINLCKKEFQEIENIKEHNQQKMLEAFIKCGVSESHFTASTGYGYNDRGRDALDKVYSEAFGTEDALVRHNFVSGTHALTVALFGILRPENEILSITGVPYDTLRSVIGSKDNNEGSLSNFGISFKYIDLNKNGSFSYEKIKETISNKTKAIYIQRSKGYSFRKSLSSKEINEVCSFIKNISKKIIILVDNCYGEFVEKEEPSDADLIVGSLIKNPGGGIAPTGGYIAGKKELINLCSYRLTTLGAGKKVGATLGLSRELFMGAFHSPNATGEALKTAVFSSALFEILGFEVYPKYNEPRHDIIECIVLKEKDLLIKFCQGIQKGSPIDSFVTPEPWDMPGYNNQIIMAAGAFTLGSSIELSADAPLKDPYAVWLQGGTNFYSAKIGIMLAADNIL
jgi:cystathionine beta-lyase family protein involved in aluminum resistance